MNADAYDHIVVGGGSAGCVLAARLSEDSGTQVLLVEAGGPHSSEINQKIASPLAWPDLMSTEACWRDTTVVQRATGTSTLVARGRGLGGSSAINAMTYARGHRSGYDAWEAAGATGWGYDDMLPYFKRSESAPHRDPAVRGTGGPLTPRLGSRRVRSFWQASRRRPSAATPPPATSVPGWKRASDTPT